MIPAMWEIMKGTQYKPFLEHFRIAAGLAEGRHRGAKWNDGDFYKWMEAVSAMLAVRPDPVWNRRLRCPLRWGRSRRFQGPAKDHSNPSSIRSRLSAPQYDGTQ